MRLVRFSVVFTLGAAFACGSSSPASGPGRVTSMFAVPASLDALAEDHFFDHPFPSDFRRDPDGSAHFKGFPNPFLVPLLDAYLDESVGLLQGFSPAASIYLRFTGAIDPSTLPPDPPSAAAATSGVQLVDVDPSSPEHGTRRLVSLSWHPDPGSYWSADTLAVMPMLGRPLRAKTKYAVVVTSAIRAADGSAIVPSDELAEALGTKPPTPATQAIHDLFAPAVADLAAEGVATADIVHLTVFTTNDPTAETFAAMDAVAPSTEPPTATDWKATDQAATYDVYEGNYGPSPNFQAGTPPYAHPEDGGSFVLQNGVPVVQNAFTLRFSLVVPHADACPMPPGGYPVVIYAHGTGGDYRSYIDDGTAEALAAQCLASTGIDQIFHGTRPGSPGESDPNYENDVEVRFFNFDNMLASRTSNRQSGIDVVQEARLFTDSHVTVPAEAARGGSAIAFDASKVLFFGHSQGSINGPLFLAGSGLARGGVLSGAGSEIALALLDKTKPFDIFAAVKSLLGLSSADAEKLDVYHPTMTLVQSLIDAADPIHYARYLATAPRPGLAPKSIFQTEGIAADGSGDSYAPPPTIEALSVAIGLPRVAPGVRPIDIDAWAGIADVSLPADGVSGNLAGGAASGAIAQFVPAANSDGHFVVFDVPAARLQAATFEKNLAADPHGRVPATE